MIIGPNFKIGTPEEIERAKHEEWQALSFEQRQDILRQAIEQQRIGGNQGVRLALQTLAEGRIDHMNLLNAALCWHEEVWEQYRPGESLPSSAVEYRRLIGRVRRPTSRKADA